ERVTVAVLIGVGIATFGGVWLASSHYEAANAAASAARWAAGIFAVIWGAAFIARDLLVGRPSRLPGQAGRLPYEVKQWFCTQPLLFGGTTILILTIIAVNQNAMGVAL